MTDNIAYKATYAAINRGDGLRCAWCEKLLLEIGDEQAIDEHLTRHDERQKVLAEIEGLVAKVQRKITSKTFEDPNLCLDVMVDIDDSLAELRAKLAEMKEGK